MVRDNYIRECKITGVYDGDSYTGFVDLGFHIFTEIKIRIVVADTPELRGEERPEGLRVRDVVRDLILNKDIFIQTFNDKKGKYGRYLAEVFLPDGQKLSQWLIDNGHAEIYMSVEEVL